jgi:hypothetical protein
LYYNIDYITYYKTRIWYKIVRIRSIASIFLKLGLTGLCGGQGIDKKDTFSPHGLIKHLNL